MKKEGASKYRDAYKRIRKAVKKAKQNSVIELVLDLITESDQAVRAVHSCNSMLLLLVQSI